MEGVEPPRVGPAVSRMRFCDAATDVPPGIDQAVHEAGIASALTNLASYVEAAG